jgi:acetyl esterase
MNAILSPESVERAVREARAGLTPVMRGILERVDKSLELGRPPLYQLSVAEARVAYDAGASVLDLLPAPLAVAEWVSLGSTGLRAKRYSAEPLHRLRPTLLFFHGGGFTIGSVASHDGLCRQLALLSGAMVLSVDYRLAPEHRFPAAQNDAWAALTWLAERGESIGADVTRLAVGGDSAGGTLAAVCALMARDAGLPLSLQLLFYPGTDARDATDVRDPENSGHASRRRFAHGLLLDQAHIDWFFTQVDPQRQHRADWRFSPLLATDHAGVAPAWVGLAEFDPLVDEGLAYADTLRMAGVPVGLEIYRGVVHDFIKMGRVLPQARHAHADAAGALVAAFGKLNA